MNNVKESIIVAFAFVGVVVEQDLQQVRKSFNSSLVMVFTVLAVFLLLDLS